MNTEPEQRNPSEPVPAVLPVTNFEDLLGQGDDLWADDAEFEAFLAWLRRSRQEGRSGLPGS
jgi:hypothetical protein